MNKRQAKKYRSKKGRNKIRGRPSEPVRVIQEFEVCGSKNLIVCDPKGGNKEIMEYMQKIGFEIKGIYFGEAGRQQMEELK